MSPRILLLLAAVLAGGFALLAQGCAGDAPAPAAKDTAAPRASLDFRRGVCWVGESDPASLAYLKSIGVNSISITPFAYGHEESDQPPPGGFQFSRFRGESVDGVRQVVRDAHAAGLAVVLTPHIWYHRRDGEWRGKIAMRDDAGWQEWFRMYAEFLGPFLGIAEQEKVELFCIATELGATARREKEWRALIGLCRASFSGRLTYGANWYDEYQAIQFWDALDYIGVQAYFPLAKEGDPGLDQIIAAWEPWQKQLAEQSARWKRSILYTEFGYRPVRGNLIEPWLWSGGESNDEAQRIAYEAGLRAHIPERAPWLAGIYIWKWFAPWTGDSAPRRERRSHDGFSPQGRPAEKLLRDWFAE